MIDRLRNGMRRIVSGVIAAVVSLRENWGVGVLSVVLAVALWIFVTDQDNPEVRRAVPSQIPIENVNVPPDLGVCTRSGDTVRVTVEAQEDVFNDLVPADFAVSIDLRDVSSQEATVDVLVSTSRSGVRLVSWTPDRVSVELDSIVSRTVPVELEEIAPPPAGFARGEVVFQPTEAAVRGPACPDQTGVQSVATLEADVDLTGARTDVEQTVLLQARDQNGATVQNVDVEPDSAVATIEILQVESSGVFAVLPDITGAPAGGFVVTGLEIMPSFVVISGPNEIFQILDQSVGVRTEPITIAGASADVIRPVALLLPDGARVEQATVTVRVIIQPIGQGTPPTSGAP